VRGVGGHQSAGRNADKLGLSSCVQLVQLSLGGGQKT
jgi:hypothetical protein